ncbi:MAG: lysostaphin resistance A-like protein [Intestinibaculum porci]|uniref:CPBP family intramembrane glutamic endopeptidase n=1 Tax=Intestinibaculum porci TaxID=2487118 RepID=UPI003F1292A3
MNDLIVNRIVVFNALRISCVTSIGLLFMIIVFNSILNDFNSSIEILFNLTLPSFISLYILPKIFFKRFERVKNKEIIRESFGFKEFALYIFVNLIGFCIALRNSNLQDNLVLLFHYDIICYSEEYVYRKLILNVLCTRLSKFLSIVISATLFAFILHINENIFINLLLRFPLGIILGLIATKTKCLRYSWLAHVFYDLMMIYV